VRGFTQDDGHIFCTEDQIESEVTAFHRQALAVYEKFGFKDIQIKIALRPEPRLGDDATWDKAENAPAQRAAALASNGRSCRRGRSTARRSNTTSRTRSAAPGSSARCRSTS
jgi:threonyl-tRNA synthetase